MSIPRILIIAGSDSGGGAGIQADIKTVTMLGGHAMTAITAITAQNSEGVDSVELVSTGMVKRQIDTAMQDFGVDAIKVGMIGSAATAVAVADSIRHASVPVVVDPVMVATSGSVLADDETIAALEQLMRVATLITPNVHEFAALGGGYGIEALGERLGCAVLAKGGDREGEVIEDRLWEPGGRVTAWSSLRIDTRHSHGTGCTLASAIAMGLAEGRDLTAAVEHGRTFVREALLGAPGIGSGHGPMGHGEAGSGRVNLNQVTLPARDYAASVAFYRSLGLTQIVDAPPRYARFECPGGATLSIHVGADEQVGDALIYLESADLDAWVARLQAAGVAFDAPPADQSWLWREARLRDPAGNRLCLYKAGENRRFPPWRLLA